MCIVITLAAVVHSLPWDHLRLVETRLMQEVVGLVAKFILDESFAVLVKTLLEIL